MRLANKVAVITGSGSGVGRASALRFSGEGAFVVCADVREDWNAETVRQVEERGGKAIALHCDVANEQDVAAAVECAASEFGRFDIMFNNAGITGLKPGVGFEDFSREDWNRLVDVNFLGVYLGCKYSVKYFKQRKAPGVIVNTGSIAGMVGWGSVIYGATKGGVNQLTRGIAIECAPFDIRVNAICPAAMPLTNFSAAPGEEFADRPKEMLEMIDRMHPLGRSITADDCAAAAVFLASDDAKNITGVLLPIDGGFTAQ